MMTVMMSAKVVPAVMSAESAVAPSAAISIVPTAVIVAVWRVEPRDINVRRRRVAIVVAAAVTALAAVAMPVATRVGKLDVIRSGGRKLLRWR